MKLIITLPNQSARECPLSTSASLGRSADNTIQLDDAGVARYHAMIEKRGDGFWLNDLGSTNGTLVNGAKLAAEHQLQPGDTISLGQNTAIRVLGADGQGAPTAAPASPQPDAVPKIETSAPPSAPPPAPTEQGVPMTYILVAGFTMLTIFVVAALALWPKPPGKEDLSKMTPRPLVPTPTATKSVAAGTTPVPETTRTVSISSDTASSLEVMVSRLAAQLSGKGNYVFDPEMIKAIAARTSEYKVDVSGPAREYRLEVNRAFSDVKSMKPLFGHVLAVSQSRYGLSRGNGVGVWQLPPAIALEYAPGADLATLNTPKRSAEIAASHFQELLTIFTTEHFMYAVACFGQTREVAGTMNGKLQMIDPGDLRDFWKQVRAGIVSRDEAEKVVRFFAAGVVAENPTRFQLPPTTPLSEL